MEHRVPQMPVCLIVCISACVLGWLGSVVMKAYAKYIPAFLLLTLLEPQSRFGDKPLEF